MTYNSESHLVVIPTYNEKENIKILLNELLKLDISVLVVDDNSPDGTKEVVEDFVNLNSEIHLLNRNLKLGLGSAYRDGFSWGINVDSNFIHFALSIEE